MKMNSSRRLILFSFIFTEFFGNTIAQLPNFIVQYCSSNIGNYTDNSKYETNLKNLLSSITSNTKINSGFYNFSSGQTPDQVNAIALCRGDVDITSCHNCITDATQKILQVCPNFKEAMGWYDNCSIRYSNKTIFHSLQTFPSFGLINTVNVSVGIRDEFDKALQSLLVELRSKAAAGDSVRKYAANSTIASYETIYGLVQCTPDLSNEQCSDCLAQAIDNVEIGKIGGQVIKASCTLRFETSRFFVDTPPLTPSSGNDNTTLIAVAVVVPIVVVLIIIICVFIFLRRRRAAKKEDMESLDDISGIKNEESLQLDFNTIRAATYNFSNGKKLGQGGFGTVYKGTLPNGEEIAVKRLSVGSGQGDTEFKNEVVLVAKLQHRHLVKLLGFCLAGKERLLVYAFVANASLEKFIFDPVKRSELDWEKRYKIIGGIARGLLYLHEDSRLRIIHRDMKASNILLDGEMNPKISDFGMARLVSLDETQVNTSRIVGTYGYMAPEYAMHGQFSVKSDVYSFGVLVLEILSGQRNSSFRKEDDAGDLVGCAWRYWKAETSLDLIDPILLKNGSRSEMMRCIHMALLCVQENVNERPSMASVVLMLSSYSLTLPVPSQPPYFVHTTNEPDVCQKKKQDVAALLSNNEVSDTDLNGQ